VDVWVDGECAFDIGLELAVEAGLAPGVQISSDELASLIARDRVLKAREVALRYLSDQARTAVEVRRALGRRGFDGVVVDQVLDYINSHGYVDDAAYARAYVRSRFAGRGYGPARLRDELLRRGVDRALVDEVITEMAGEESLADAAGRLASSRWRSLDAVTDPRRRRQRTLEYLVRRGYSYDVAREAVERATADENDEASWFDE
jgi:regulatory protein